jgi:hypothetical protein
MNCSNCKNCKDISGNSLSVDCEDGTCSVTEVPCLCNCHKGL